MFFHLLSDLSCKDTKKALILTSSSGSDQQVNMIVLNGKLIDLDKEPLSIGFHDFENEEVPAVGAEARF